MRFFPISLAFILLVSQILADEVSALQKAGIPALDHEWRGDDYLRTANILADGKVPLPRLSTETGKRFLDRICSPDNLALYRNRNLPLNVRMQDGVKMTTAMDGILKAYEMVALTDRTIHAETAHLTVFVLRVSAFNADGAEEFLPTIPKNENNADRQAGFQEFKESLAATFAVAESALSDKTFFSSEDHLLILGAMSETLPSLKKFFTADDKIQFRKSLTPLQAAFPRPSDAKMIQQMIDTLAE